MENKKNNSTELAEYDMLLKGNASESAVMELFKQKLFDT